MFFFSDCSCGTGVCNEINGMTCFDEENRCTEACVVLDGSKPNTESCSCGTDECTEDTGLYCRTRVSSPSIKRVKDLHSFLRLVSQATMVGSITTHQSLALGLVVRTLFWADGLTCCCLVSLAFVPFANVAILGMLWNLFCWRWNHHNIEIDPLQRCRGMYCVGKAKHPKSKK